VKQGRIEVHLVSPARHPCGQIRLRLPHTDKQSLRSVTVNGKAHAGFDASKEWIVLPGDLKGALEVIARY
jgi:hypothetical protein